MAIERASMETDIAAVGFGPAAAGFLATIAPKLAETKDDGTPKYESKVMPGCPLQVQCFERADSTGFGVSGIVSKAEAIKKSFPGLDLAAEIPNSSEVKKEKMVYLFDHIGASKRSIGTKFIDLSFKIGGLFMKKGPFARELPFIPRFMDKKPGLVLNMGAFMDWCAGKLMEQGVMVMAGQPVAEVLFDGNKAIGIRMADQGVDRTGAPQDGVFMPGMDVKAALTVVADGPVGAVGRKLDEKFGLPDGHHHNDWGVGMKAVVQLPDTCKLEPGTVIHTLGFPEPEIFGFMYVLPNRTASMGIFVAPWQDTPVRTTYRYLQHWMMHPYIWREIEGGTLLSWGAKSLQESGLEGEPFLTGDGFARIGEGSGTTDCLANSGVDEAWESGTMLAQCVLELLDAGKEFTQANLQAYVDKRRTSATFKRLKKATGARNGFNKSFFWGMTGEALTGYLGLHLPFKSRPPHERVPGLDKALKGRIKNKKTFEEALAAAKKARQPLHDAVMDAEGWPPIPFDGKLLMSHQDVLLAGGKVQAMAATADHVVFKDKDKCKTCTKRTCIEICSAQAIMPNEEDGLPPAFDREKCVHCGACIWNCSQANIDFLAGAGGLHSNEN